jgi:SAM-dependent methyltransferase
VIVMERSSTGERHPLEVDAWHAPPTAVELELVDRLPAPVLDVGCGPGRIAAALAARGVPSLGIDVSDAALATASRAGAAVLDRSVFDPMPGEGRWGSALLLDGNVGIGGDPARLLERVGELLRPGGVALVEVEGHGRPTVVDRVRLRCSHHGDGPWFGWAWVGADDVGALARGAGFDAACVEVHGERHFARLVRGAAR